MNNGCPRQKRLQQHLGGLLFYLLLAITVALAGWLGERHPRAWDWSDNAGNSLSANSITLLQRLQAPVEIQVFAADEPRLRQPIRDIVARYQRVRPEIHLSFIDPARRPDLTRELNIRANGEMRLTYQGRSEQLRQIDEYSISNAIQRLIRQGGQWITTVTGHGERNLLGHANHDLGSFGDELKRKGYQIRQLDLAQQPRIPDDSGLLLIASPQTSYLAREIRQIQDYLQRGGNMLWLTEPDPQGGLEPLAKVLGIARLPGIIVDAGAADLRLDDPAMAVVSHYPDHPATQHFDRVTLYPYSAALEGVDGSDWQLTSLLQTGARSWNETGPIRGKVTLDRQQGERLGPLTIGLALQRQRQSGEQRVLVVGDGDFLANSYLGNGGNLDLGLNLIRWLSGDDELIGIPARTSRDLNLRLSRTAGLSIGFGFLLLLPLLLFLTGLLIWWRRRRR